MRTLAGYADFVLARVRDGVFFTTPEPLPRGRHDLSRDQVLAAQRERLMIAVTELLAEHGYQAVGIREIAARAAVSRAAFYECFTSKEECAFAAYDRFMGVLLSRLAKASESDSDWPTFLSAMIGAYLGACQEDPVVARAFQVEMDALGFQARAQRRSSLRALAEFIREARERLFADAERDLPPPTTYLAVVYAVRQIAVDAIDEQEDPDLLALVPDLVAWVAGTLRRSDQYS